jgi:hypothetical protein
MGGRKGRSPDLFFCFVGLGQVGGDQTMAVLKEMNDLEAGDEAFV